MLALIAAASIAADQNASVGNTKTAPAWGTPRPSNLWGGFSTEWGGSFGSGELAKPSTGRVVRSVTNAGGSSVG